MVAYYLSLNLPRDELPKRLLPSLSSTIITMPHAHANSTADFLDFLQNTSKLVPFVGSQLDGLIGIAKQITKVLGVWKHIQISDRDWDLFRFRIIAVIRKKGRDSNGTYRRRLDSWQSHSIRLPPKGGRRWKATWRRSESKVKEYRVGHILTPEWQNLGVNTWQCSRALLKGYSKKGNKTPRERKCSWSESETYGRHG